MNPESNKPEEGGVGTTGHEWDGIKELNNPLPRWWLYTFYATVVWAIGYCVLYPAWPGISDATKGVLGWSSRGAVAAELQQVAQARAELVGRVEATPVEQLPNDPKLMRFAVEGGKSAFKVYCVQCHGSGAAGGKGYPNLNDDDWLWSGSLAGIEETIREGIRNPDHDRTRTSAMPAFGRDGVLQPAQISDVVAHVRTISGQQRQDAAARRGALLFAENCAACHGPGGTGNRDLGAPNLADAIWLYGGDPDSIRATIANSRNGVMPRWGHRLDPVTIRMLAAYVHSLGGGETGSGQVERTQR